MDSVQSVEERPSQSDSVREIREIWRNATADSVSSDLQRARSIVDGLPEGQRAKGEVYLEAIARLERWLHDL